MINHLATLFQFGGARGLEAGVASWLEKHPETANSVPAKLAAHAYSQAAARPGCLARIVLKENGDVDQMCETVGRAFAICNDNHMTDEVKTRAASVAGKTIIELVNGSAIEFVIEK